MISQKVIIPAKTGIQHLRNCLKKTEFGLCSAMAMTKKAEFRHFFTRPSRRYDQYNQGKVKLHNWQDVHNQLRETYKIVAWPIFLPTLSTLFPLNFFLDKR